MQASQSHIATLKRYGKPLPEEYLKGPTLSPALMFYFDAFCAVSTDRQVGMATGPLPFSAVDRYARRVGILDPDAFKRLWALMRRLDAEFMADAARKSGTPPAPPAQDDDDGPDPAAAAALARAKRNLRKRQKG